MNKFHLGGRVSSCLLLIVIGLMGSHANPQSTGASVEQTYTLVSSWGSPGTGAAQLLEPADISIDSNNTVIYIADKGNNRIQKFDYIGNLLLSWGTFGSSAGQFNAPGDVIVDLPNKYVLVADIGNNRIQKFDLNGTFISSWGSAGRGSGQFDQPGDIAIDSDEGLVFVTDIGNHRIQKFDLNGTFISKWGTIGSADGQLNRPAGVTYDKVGKLVYVADTNNNRIQKFDINGTFVGKWGSAGNRNGQLDNPASLGVDPISGHVFVVDTGNKRIQEMDQNGNFVSVWGTKGVAAGQFEQPVGIALDREGRVYVLDKDNTRIQAFSSSNLESSHITQDTSKGVGTNDGNNNDKSSKGDNEGNDNSNSRTESGTFQVRVKLDNVDTNPGDYRVSITVYGNSKLRESENVDTEHQMCPHDIDTQCYTPVGPFKFPASKVPVGSKVEVCVTEPLSDEKECNSRKNTSKNEPETTRIDVPDISAEQISDNGNNKEDDENDDWNDSQHDYINCNIEDCTDGSYRCPNDIDSHCYKIEDD